MSKMIHQAQPQQLAVSHVCEAAVQHVTPLRCLMVADASRRVMFAMTTLQQEKF